MRAAFRTADPGLIGSIVPGLSKVMVVVGVALCFTLLSDVGQAQAAKPEALTNPSFEVWSDQADEGGDEARPAGWSFVTRPQGTQSLTLSTDSPADGEASALVDVTSGANEFTNVMQAIEATPFLGQRVRLRAAVRTASLASETRVQLWFRIDTESGMGDFDNMQDRPIRADSWQDFDIVLDVAEDATRLNVGLFVVGSGKAWIDHVRLDAVDDQVEPTSVAPSEFRAALAATAEAPPQPLWTPWLWLALLTVSLFVLSQLGSPMIQTEAFGSIALPMLVRFAFRFSAIYWLLYSLPQPLGTITPSFLQPVLTMYSEARDAVVRWTGAALLKIEGEMFAPNGSGDTTYAYVSLLFCCLGAMLGATVWSLLDRKKSDLTIPNDVLRSYLRYVLAATMIGYGLAKVGFIRNQFPTPGDFQLSRTYGESSPMGLLWTFMGASRAYTIFAGLGELLGGVLLLWRRTTTLGALIVVAVMTNVVALNFAYDVPVKQYSVHLVVMALFLLLPEAGRLTNVLWFNRATEDRDLGSPLITPSSSRRARWTYRIAKAVLVILIGCVPIVGHLRRELQHARSANEASEEGPSVATEAEHEPLLLKRGFRWISEAPYNR